MTEPAAPPPPVCESAQYTHFSWHMISRSNAYDVVASAERMKDFCRLMPCPTAETRSLDFSRIQFGWLVKFGHTRPAAAAAKLPGPDVVEYVASRAAAWDCPIALHATLAELQSNPRAEDCLAAIKTWEDARVGNHLSDEDRRVLRNVAPEDARYVPCFEQRQILQNILDNRDLTPSQRRILADRREHHLFMNEQGRYELAQIEEVPDDLLSPLVDNHLRGEQERHTHEQPSMRPQVEEKRDARPANCVPREHRQHEEGKPRDKHNHDDPTGKELDRRLQQTGPNE